MQKVCLFVFSCTPLPERVQGGGSEWREGRVWPLGWGWGGDWLSPLVDKGHKVRVTRRPQPGEWGEERTGPQGQQPGGTHLWSLFRAATLRDDWETLQEGKVTRPPEASGQGVLSTTDRETEASRRPRQSYVHPFLSFRGLAWFRGNETKNSPGVPGWTGRGCIMHGAELCGANSRVGCRRRRRAPRSPGERAPACSHRGWPAPFVGPGRAVRGIPSGPRKASVCQQNPGASQVQRQPVLLAQPARGSPQRRPPHPSKGLWVLRPPPTRPRVARWKPRPAGPGQAPPTPAIRDHAPSWPRPHA